MNYRSYILRALLWFAGVICSVDLTFCEATVYGKSLDWANKELTFCLYKELITNSEEILASVTIQEDGTFELKIPVKETEYVFAHLGIFKIYFYAVPGEKYELVLPPFQEKSATDLLNPYFEELTMQVGIVDIAENDLNLLIRMFDDAYEPFLQQTCG